MRIYHNCPSSENTIHTLGEDGRLLDKPRVELKQPMEVIHMGAEQFLPDGSQHYPNVDILQCPGCGVRMVRE